MDKKIKLELISLKNHSLLVTSIENDLKNIKIGANKNITKQELSNLIFEVIKSNLDEIKKDNINSFFPENKNSNIQDLISEIQDAIKVIDLYYKNLLELDVKDYLSLNTNFMEGNFTKNLSIDKFKLSYEDKVINFSNKTNNLLCSNCSINNSKSNLNFSTSISTFLAISNDAQNFLWNFDTRIPLCEICELIYFCYFASFTDIGNKKFYFVNQDSSIKEIYSSNMKLKQILNRNLKENILLEFFSELILEKEKRKSIYSIQNISFIEIDLFKDILPKIHSFNISKEKANFFVDNQENFKKIEKNILIETIELILKNQFNYNYLYKLTKIYIKTKEFKLNFNFKQLQELNLLIFNFIEKVILRKEKLSMENSDLWKAHNKGLRFSEMLRTSNAENKLVSLSYKLLNSLRVGDINSFLDIIMRIHISYNQEVPSIFTKAITSKENFYPIGYSFVIGLLGKKYDKDDKGEINE